MLKEVPCHTLICMSKCFKRFIVHTFCMLKCFTWFYIRIHVCIGTYACQNVLRGFMYILLPMLDTNLFFIGCKFTQT